MGVRIRSRVVGVGVGAESGLSGHRRVRARGLQGGSELGVGGVWTGSVFPTFQLCRCSQVV